MVKMFSMKINWFEILVIKEFHTFYTSGTPIKMSIYRPSYDFQIYSFAIGWTCVTRFRSVAETECILEFTNYTLAKVPNVRDLLLVIWKF